MAADVGRMMLLACSRGGCDSHRCVTASESLPTDLAAAHAMIIAERAARLEAEAVASASAKAAATGAKAEAANAQADLSSTKR